MPSPFPGMDPYLEHGEYWRGFHHSLAEALKAQLNARLSTRYFADVEVQTVWEEVSISTPTVTYPDVGVLERRVAEPPPAVALVGPGTSLPPAPILRTVVVPAQTRLRSVRVYQTETRRLVTSIELLSPYNKRPGDGLDEYHNKRLRLLQSDVHLIEIDLLRGGQRPGREVAEPALDTDYVLLVNRYRGGGGRVSEIWPAALNQALPLLPAPLLPPDPDATLDLGAAVQSVYASARYEMRIDYGGPPPPPELRPAMAAWLEESLRKKT